MLLLAFRTQVATSHFSIRPPVEFLAAVKSFKVLFRSRCRSCEIRADIYDMYLEIFPSSALKTAKCLLQNKSAEICKRNSRDLQ